jgi:hypothetical protein
MKDSSPDTPSMLLSLRSNLKHSHARAQGISPAKDLEPLNGRAGSHSWGYGEPSEAAVELLTEAVEDRVEEMKRNLELGLLAPAEALCAGIVQGLYRARDTRSDGALRDGLRISRPSKRGL